MTQLRYLLKVASYSPEEEDALRVLAKRQLKNKPSFLKDVVSHAGMGSIIGGAGGLLVGSYDANKMLELCREAGLSGADSRVARGIAGGPVAFDTMAGVGLGTAGGGIVGAIRHLLRNSDEKIS